MKSWSRKSLAFLSSGATVFLLFALIAAMNLATGADSGAEWLYTLLWINRIALPVLFLAGLVVAIYGFMQLLKRAQRNPVWICCGALSCLLFVIPQIAPSYITLSWEKQYLLSACWGAAFILGAIAFFTLATKTNETISAILCGIGSVAIGLGIVEIVLLCSAQYEDGISDLSAESRYLAAGPGKAEYLNWTPYECGRIPSDPKGPVPSTHRLAKFDQDIFDRKYTFNEKGWRALPGSGHAEKDLLLFGCSFTFGYGLSDEQTWAWKLAKLLGPSWRLENYAANGYGPNHMLCMLEHHLITPPTGSQRYAVFLAIEHHLRRNDFFPNTPHYELNASGEPRTGGKPRFVWAFNLGCTFNGSQSAREAGRLIQRLVSQHRDPWIQLFLGEIKKSARLLNNDYDTKLIVLLWPDMDFLREDLEKMGITALSIKPWLQDWDSGEFPGVRYMLNPRADVHPNDQATTEIATGLASYFQQIATEAASRAE